VTKNQVIEQLFISKNFNDCLIKMEPDHLRDDLKAEVILIVCELPSEKILGLHERNELEFYTVRIILNLIKSSTSPFAKKYRQNTIELSMKDHPVIDINEIHDRADREQKEDMIIGQIENLHWYKSEMVKLYMRLGNYRAIEAETRIPFGSCYKSIKQSFAELKAAVK